MVSCTARRRPKFNDVYNVSRDPGSFLHVKLGPVPEFSWGIRVFCYTGDPATQSRYTRKGKGGLFMPAWGGSCALGPSGLKDTCTVKPLILGAEGGAKFPTHVVGLGVTPAIQDVGVYLGAEITPILSHLAITPPCTPTGQEAGTFDSPLTFSVEQVVGCPQVCISGSPRSVQLSSLQIPGPVLVCYLG